MPMDRSRYPDNWDEIARGIKERAGWKCEECGVEHGRHIVRLRTDPAKFFYISDQQAQEEYSHYSVRAVMTVHHIGIQKPDGSPGDPDDKMDCRPENLICLCQRCHLLADQEGHIQKSTETRIRKKHESQLEAGQQELFG